MKSNCLVTQHEYELRDDQNLLSRTDLKGRITYAAPGFIEASGYSREELIGAPHSLVRHPDMPREAFANLWETLLRREVWAGVVKNRRKNGDFYWVRANVAPIIENGEVLGYSSVRVKASPQERLEAEQAYARIRAGDTRGIRLERGTVVRTGLSGWDRRLEASAFKVCLGGMIGLNLILLAICIGLGYFGFRYAGSHVRQLQSDLGDSASAALLAALQDHQQSLFWAQTGLLLLVGSLMLVAGLAVVRGLLRQLREAAVFSMQIATGNLAAMPPAMMRGEIGRLMDMLIIMRTSLGNIVTDVYQCLGEVQPAAQSIARGNVDLSRRTEQQAGALQQTASSMEQITATVQQNAANARHASSLSHMAAEEVQATGSAMKSVVQSMERISSSSGKIAEIIQVIDSIAFQTNILALNASVEAARAGEHGRGFAVVASEVRNLATRSAAAAQDVHALIEVSSREIHAGEQHVGKAEAAIRQVVEAVLEVDGIMNEIAAASEEQTRGIELVNQAVAQMDEVTQRNAELVQQSARDAANLDTQVAELSNVISALRVSGRGVEHVSRQDRFAARAARRRSEPDRRGGKATVLLEPGIAVAPPRERWAEF
ncbi:methyl-accepting chemotaxis protein [Azotobacter vinelandii]